MKQIKFYNKIYGMLQYNSSTLLTYDDELFEERLAKLQADDSSYANSDNDIIDIRNTYISFDEFKEDYRKVFDEVIQKMTEYGESISEKYIDVKNIKLYTDYPKCTLVTGHKYISIDIKDAAIQALIDDGALTGFTSWTDLISSCTDNTLLINSKAFKIDIIRHFYKSNKLAIRTFMVKTLNKILTGDNVLATSFKDVTPNLFLGDEVVFDITDDYNKYDEILGDRELEGVNVHIKKFSYTEIGWYTSSNQKSISIFPIREYSDGDIYMPRKTCRLFWLVYNFYHNFEDTPNDYKVQVDDFTILTLAQKPQFITGDELEELKKTKIIE